MRLNAGQRKDKIVKAASALFSERGFNGATTRELARRAGISEALLFRHFPDKKRLYQAILQSRMEETLPSLLKGLRTESKPADVLYELASRMLAHNTEDPSFLRLLLFSALEGHKLSDLFFQRRTLPLRDFLEGYFRGAIREGKIKKTDPEAAALAFLALVFSYIQTRVLFRIPQVVRRSPEDLLKKYVSIFLKGIEGIGR